MSTFILILSYSCTSTEVKWNVSTVTGWIGTTNIHEPAPGSGLVADWLLMLSCSLMSTVETKPTVVKVSADAGTICFLLLSLNREFKQQHVSSWRRRWIPGGFVSVVLFGSEKLLQQRSSAVVWTQSRSLIRLFTSLNLTLYKAVKVWLREDQLFKMSPQ